MAYTSHVELSRAKEALRGLITDTEQTIGIVALHHYNALQGLLKNEPPEVVRHANAGRGPLKRTEIIHEVNFNPAAMQDRDGFGLQKIETITHRRQFSSRHAGSAALALRPTNRAVGLYYGNAGGKISQVPVAEIAQNGEVEVNGFVTKPRRLQGDLTTQTYIPGEPPGYETESDLRCDYSTTYRGALAIAALCNTQLPQVHGASAIHNGEIAKLSEDWLEVDRQYLTSVGSVMRLFKKQATP